MFKEIRETLSASRSMIKAARQADKGEFTLNMLASFGSKTPMRTEVVSYFSYEILRRKYKDLSPIVCDELAKEYEAFKGANQFKSLCEHVLEFDTQVARNHVERLYEPGHPIIDVLVAAIQVKYGNYDALKKIQEIHKVYNQDDLVNWYYFNALRWCGQEYKSKVQEYIQNPNIKWNFPWKSLLTI